MICSLLSVGYLVWKWVVSFILSFIYPLFYSFHSPKDIYQCIAIDYLLGIHVCMYQDNFLLLALCRWQLFCDFAITLSPLPFPKGLYQLGKLVPCLFCSVFSQKTVLILSLKGFPPNQPAVTLFFLVNLSRLSVILLLW